jgi:stearoyl-CoA desaturase (delta-9 desaturase)
MFNWIPRNLETYRITKQIPATFAIIFPYHIAAFLGIYLACTAWSWTYAVYLLAGYVVIGGLGDAVVLHRYLSHQSIEVRPWLKPILYWLACMTGQGSPIWWAALHRGYHHAHTDKDRDIHSPIKGNWNSYMGWMFNITHDTVNLKYGASLLRDKTLVVFHKNYNTIVWTTLIISFVISPMFCLCFFVIPAVISLHTENLVNLICHSHNTGYRPFETKDQSENVWYLGLFGWGQGWHNNHHAHPKSFDFGTSVSKKWYEFDPCLLLVPFVASWSETKRLWNIWRTQCAG